MRTLCDLIEAHLRQLLAEGAGQPLEVQRQQLAARFRCVPSQINYVLETRFPVERGYLVETRRGGRGYIRISRFAFESPLDLILGTYRAVGETITSANGCHMVLRLQEEGMLNRLEAELMRVVLVRGSPRDRARLLRSMLLCLLQEKVREQAARSTGAAVLRRCARHAVPGVPETPGVGASNQGRQQPAYGGQPL